MGHFERKMRDRQAVKQAILNAAREIARADGWQAVTIRRIAEKIEYTPPVVYEHFVNKADLMAELVRIGSTMINMKIEEVLREEPAPRQYLREFAAIMWDFAFTDADLYQLMFNSEFIGRTGPPAEAKRSLDSLEKALGRLIENSDQRVEDLMFHWFCLTYGAITVTIRFPLPPELKTVNRKELYLRMVNRFIDSI
jgi:AcrR family transcriptional regulator